MSIAYQNRTSQMPVVTKKSSHVLSLEDAGKIIEMDMATENEIVISTEAKVPFPNGTVIGIANYGMGATKIVAEEGVTILSGGGKTTLLKHYTRAILEK